MTVVLAQRLTLDEFLALPDEKPALEFEPDGRVTQKVSPKGKHSSLQGTLCELINRYAARDRIARAYSELRAVFGGAAYVPDVSVYRWDRIPRDPNGEVADDFRTPPDIALEIVSPRQSTNALVRRCLWYVGNSVNIALLIDPADRSVVRFFARAQAVALRDDDVIAVDEVLPDLKLTVNELFATLVVT
jgi:Uma2 family endonuclease